MKLRVLGALLLALSATVGIQARGGSAAAVTAASTTSLPSFKATGGAGVTIQDAATQQSKFDTLKGYIDAVLANTGDADAGADGIKADVPKPSLGTSQMNVFVRTSESGKQLLEYFVSQLITRAKTTSWMFEGKDIDEVVKTAGKIVAAVTAIQSSMGSDNIDFSKNILGESRSTTISGDITQALSVLAAYTGGADAVTPLYVAWFKSSVTSWNNPSDATHAANLATVAESLRNTKGSANGQITKAAFVSQAATIATGLVAIPDNIIKAMKNGTFTGWTSSDGGDDLYMLVRRISMDAVDIFTAHKSRLLMVYRAAGGGDISIMNTSDVEGGTTQADLTAADAAIAAIGTAPAASSSGRGGRS